MKKTLYYITLVLILLSGNVSAQHTTYADSLLQAIALGKPTTNTPQQKTNALMSRMVGSSTYLYNSSVNGYVIHDTINLKYSGNRGGDASQNLFSCKYDTANFILPDLSTGSFPITHRYTATYNAHDNIVSSVVAVYDQATGNFVEQIRTNFYYDTNEYRISDTTFGWSATSHQWVPSTGAWQYVNNANGSVLSATHYIYDDSRQQWVRTAAEKVEYTYDANGNLTTRTFVANNMGTLENQSRDVFTYNVSGKTTAYTRQEWSYIYTWDNTTEIYYTLNTNGDAENELVLQYNRATGVMDTGSLSLNSYDANHNLTETIRQEYNYNTHTFVTSGKLTQTYNSFNQLTGIESARWNNGGFWDLDDGDYKNNYYYETYFPTDVARLQKQGGTLQLYPVPANNTLNVSINWKEAQPYTLTIADMQGRVNMQYSSNNANETIDVTMLPAGVYNIILKGDKGGVQHGRFSVVR